MSTKSVKSDSVYVRNLLKAGLDGVTSGWKTTDDVAFASALTNAIWPAAVGGGIGVLSIGLMSKRRRSGYSMAAGGLIGSALGFGVGVAWASRVFTRTVLRSALQKVNEVRDARWLEKNPIDYA